MGDRIYPFLQTKRSAHTFIVPVPLLTLFGLQSMALTIGQAAAEAKVAAAAAVPATEAGDDDIDETYDGSGGGGGGSGGRGVEGKASAQSSAWQTVGRGKGRPIPRAPNAAGPPKGRGYGVLDRATPWNSATRPRKSRGTWENGSISVVRDSAAAVAPLVQVKGPTTVDNYQTRQGVPEFLDNCALLLPSLPASVNGKPVYLHTVKSMRETCVSVGDVHRLYKGALCLTLYLDVLKSAAGVSTVTRCWTEDGKETTTALRAVEAHGGTIVTGLTFDMIDAMQFCVAYTTLVTKGKKPVSVYLVQAAMDEWKHNVSATKLMNNGILSMALTHVPPKQKDTYVADTNATLASLRKSSVAASAVLYLQSSNWDSPVSFYRPGSKETFLSILLATEFPAVVVRHRHSWLRDLGADAVRALGEKFIIYAPLLSWDLLRAPEMELLFPDTKRVLCYVLVARGKK